MVLWEWLYIERYWIWLVNNGLKNSYLVMLNCVIKCNVLLSGIINCILFDVFF